MHVPLAGAWFEMPEASYGVVSKASYGVVSKASYGVVSKGGDQLLPFAPKPPSKAT